MAFSANPLHPEAQRGLSFALRPFQGAIADVADNVSGVMSAIGEIDSLRIDNASLRSENERLTNENARLQALKRENDELTAALQLQGGFNHKTVATRVIGRDSLDTRQMVTLDKGTDDGIAQGDVVIVQGGALAGRVTDVGPNFAKVTLISDGTSTVVGPAPVSGKTGEIVGQAGGVLIMKQHRLVGRDRHQRGGVHARASRSTAGSARPTRRACVIGSVVDVQRDANDVVQTAFLAPAADLDAFEVALVITDYDGGLPPVDEQAVPCGSNGTVPQGEVACYTPAPKPAASPKK